MRSARHIGALVATLLGAQAAAGPVDQVVRIHDRLTGVPPDAGFVARYAPLVESDPLEVAFAAMQDSAFYTVTLKNFATPWSNEEGSRFEPLNDYTATVIGLVRDRADFRRLLYDNVIYVGRGGLGLPAYGNSDNRHYEALEALGLDWVGHLRELSQTEVSGLPEHATAGVMTTRAAASAFLKDGTNRAMLRFTLLNHLCRDLEQVKDTTLPAGRIRQDVSRSPGGDSRLFLNSCVGCHSGMDPMAQAFAYYQYSYDADQDPDGLSGRLTWNAPGQLDPVTGSRVQEKYRINANNFSPGFITPDDRWTNYWRQGKNAALGWDRTLDGAGNGAKGMGRELAHSQAFARCQVEKVFGAVCLRPPADAEDRLAIESMVSNFAGSGYDLQQVFADSASYCRGD